MRGENENIEILSYLHASPLHPNVVLWELHNLRDIQGAQNHYLKLVESELMNMWQSHGKGLYLCQSSYNLACFTYFHTCWRSLIGKTFPWMISRPCLQTIMLIRKDGMNGLILCLWHHLGCGLTNTK